MKYTTYNDIVVRERNKTLRPGDVFLTERGVYYVLTNGRLKQSISLPISAGESYNGDPTIIVQNSTHRFVTDAQITTWDAGVVPTIGSNQVGYGTTGTGILTSSSNFTFDSAAGSIVAINSGGGLAYGSLKLTSQAGNPTVRTSFTASYLDSNVNTYIQAGGITHMYLGQNNIVAYKYTNFLDTVQIGTGTPLVTSDLGLVSSAAGLVTSMTNTSNTGRSLFTMGQSSLLWSGLFYFNSSYGSNYTGTTISQNSSLQMFNGTNAGNSTMVISGTPIINLVGDISTNYGTRLDSTGLRIGQLSTLHTSNTKKFSVNNLFYYDDSAIHAEITVLAPSSSDYIQLQTQSTNSYLVSSRPLAIDSIGGSIMYRTYGSNDHSFRVNTSTEVFKVGSDSNVYLSQGGYMYGDTTTPYVRLSNASGAFLAYSTNYFVAGSAALEAYISSTLKFKIENTVSTFSHALKIADGSQAVNTVFKGDATGLGTWSALKTINSNSLFGSGDIAISGTLADGDYGDVTLSSSGTVITIDNNAVTLAKIATIADQTILGNNTGGAASPVALTAAQTKTVLSLGNVENTALSTWAGTTNITTLGTIGTGTWNATVIDDAKIDNTLTGKSVNGVTLTTGGLATEYLSGDGTYNTPAGGGGGPTKISGTSGAFGGDSTWITLTSNSSDITSTTQTVVMTVTGLDAGTYRIKGTIIYQTAATGTGIGITLNHTGTTTTFVSNWIHITTGGAAATGISDQSTATAAGQLVEGKAERVIDTRSSFTVGVDAPNANELAVIDAIIIVSVSGNLQLKIATEVGGSAVRLMAGSVLEINKTV